MILRLSPVRERGTGGHGAFAFLRSSAFKCTRWSVASTRRRGRSDAPGRRHGRLRRQEERPADRLVRGQDPRPRLQAVVPAAGADVRIPPRPAPLHRETHRNGDGRLLEGGGKVVRDGKTEELGDLCPGIDPTLWAFEMAVRGVAGDIEWKSMPGPGTDATPARRRGTRRTRLVPRTANPWRGAMKQRARGPASASRTTAGTTRPPLPRTSHSGSASRGPASWRWRSRRRPNVPEA